MWTTSTARLWREMARRWGEVHILARSRDQRFRIAKRESVTVHLLPKLSRRMLSFLLLSPLVVIQIVRIRPSVLLAQSAVHGGLVCVLVARVLRIPVLVEVHGEHYVRPGQVGKRAHRWLIKPLARISFAGATRIRSLSPEMTRALVDTYGDGLRDRIVEIGSRVDIQVFSPPKESYAASTPLRLVMVGALEANKNQLALIEHLSTSGVACELVLVGQGAHEAAIKAKARETGLHVELTGAVTHDELPGILRASDIYVQYSRSEAVPRAVLEAMAVGVPVIVAPGGFLAGIVDHARTGYRLESWSPDALRRALTSLNYTGARERLGKAGRQRVLRDCEWNAVFSRYVGELRDLAAGAEGSSGSPTLGHSRDDLDA
jgi:glycosyltransferase involved in cell wall biosynthesis